MRILIDVNHPAHVHLFRYAAREWESRGHHVFWTARDKDLVVELLQHYGFEYRVLSTYSAGLARMAINLAVRDRKLFRMVRKLRPDVMLGTSINITHVSRLTQSRSIFFTESDPHLIRLISHLSFPFADLIVMPDILPDTWPSKQVKYPSYHELAYLHPRHFTPDSGVLNDLGVAPDEPFFLLRFIGWGASHDVGQGGLNLKARRRVIEALQLRGRVLITAEGKLQSEFEPYRIRLAPHRIHDALYYATLFVGDSQTMTVEAAVLGTPAIRCNTFVGRCSVIEELEHKYGLTYGFLPKDEDKMFDKIMELLGDENLHNRWQQRRRRMLKDKIDLTAWMVDFVENYPESWYRYRET